MNFLLIAILAYSLNGLVTIVDKILIQKSIPNPLIYVFYMSILGSSVLFLIPFGVQFEIAPIAYGSLSGIFANLALITYFQALKKGEASIVSPVVGGINPLFSLIVGGLFLGQILTLAQLFAFFLTLLGAAVLTANVWKEKLTVNHQLLLMIASGCLFGLAYVFLRETFLASNFFSGLVFPRLAGLIFVLTFLFYPNFRKQLFSSKITHHMYFNKVSLILLSGQTLGAASALLINFAITLASPALVNSLFGFQYLVILIVALVLAKEHRGKLLDEDLSKKALAEKVVGAVILSIGVYLLSK